MIKIDTEFITLGQLLKMTDWISSGGEAKLAVKELKITVNGEKEDRRGRKLYPGDQISKMCIRDRDGDIGIAAGQYDGILIHFNFDAGQRW